MKNIRQERIELRKLLRTSNISAENGHLKVGYKELLNEEEYVQDNAVLMLIKLLIRMKAKKVLLAGFDGYSYDENDNYALQGMAVYRKKDILASMNAGMRNTGKDESNRKKM